MVARRRFRGFAAIVLVATLGGCSSTVPGPVTAPPGAAQPDAPLPPPGRIVFTRFEFEAGTRNPSGADLWSVATDGSDLVRLTDLPELEGMVAWSPDADRLVFSRSASATEGDLWVIDADPTAADRHLRQLTDGPGFEGAPAWSPDGAWIAYVTDWQNNASIWICAADGSGSRGTSSTVTGRRGRLTDRGCW